MKKLSPLLILIISFSLFSCEKVIDINLDEAEPALVIEALLNQNEGRITVEITKSGPYFSPAELEKINDADIILLDEDGFVSDVAFVENGLYEAEVEATPGATYHLEVVIDENLYTASSYLPPPVVLSSLSTDLVPATGVFDAGLVVYALYEDPVDQQNFYRLRYTVDGVFQNGADDLNIFDDQFNNGSLARMPVSREPFEEGTIVQVELLHFDQSSFDYLSGLVDIISQGQSLTGGSSAPGNPMNNWNGEVLGYFSAFNSDTQTIVVE